VRSPQDRLRGGVIEALLCRHEAELSPCLLADVHDRITPFAAAGLASISGNRLTIRPDGLPYARVIAALFDTYRESAQQRFSSAI
jgi:oxygen-independent coproporphyrinogen-3 oxidase